MGKQIKKEMTKEKKAVKGFQGEKDRTLGEIRCPLPGYVRVTMVSYDGGELKVQIGPKVLYKNSSGVTQYSHAIRLTLDEMEWLLKNYSALKITVGIK